ncbi:MAG: hypothetical protein BGN86_00690 [Caulobacterales bacterium 68-7]|nr:MAG: hypothetical protein BGN86_00690 [Caulobacterales bacterium 68-7]
MFGSLVGGVSKTPSSAGLDMSWMQAEPSKDSQSAARTEFGDYMKMSPAEKMRAEMLKRLGVTEEEYKAMSTEKRQLIDKQIEDMIKQEAQLAADQEGKKGLFADVKV